MVHVWSRRCVMFTLLLAMCAAGALEPARAEAAVPRPSQMASYLNGIAMLAPGNRVPIAGVQRCSGAIDATGTAGAGIGRLIEVGHGIYDLVLQLNPEFLAQFSPELMSFGYQVTYPSMVKWRKACSRGISTFASATSTSIRSSGFRVAPTLIRDDGGKGPPSIPGISCN